MNKALLQIYAGSALLALFLTATAQGQIQEGGFSVNPRVPLQNYDMQRGRDVQRFSGAFVKRLGEDWSSNSARHCLRSMDGSEVQIETFSSGAVHASFPANACANSLELASDSSAVPTSRTSLTADRVLALAVVAQRFISEPRFATNDRDLAHYDVEIYEKNGALNVLLEAPPSKGTIAGCPHTGAIDTMYVVNMQTFTAKLGRMVC